MEGKIKGAQGFKPSQNVRFCRPSRQWHPAPAQGPGQRCHGVARCSGGKEGSELRPVRSRHAGGPLPVGLPTWRWWCMPDPSTSLKVA